MNSSSIAPMIEPIQPAVCSPWPSSVVARNPPTNDPAMPSRIVTIHPPGSRPGMRNFAIAQTTRPNRSHPMMFICFPPSYGDMVEQRQCQPLILQYLNGGQVFTPRLTDAERDPFWRGVKT